MPLQTSTEGTPSELPPPIMPQPEVVPYDELPPEKDSSAEDKAKERESVRGILEKGDDLAIYNPVWPPERGHD